MTAVCSLVKSGTRSSHSDTALPACCGRRKDRGALVGCPRVPRGGVWLTPSSIFVRFSRTCFMPVSEVANCAPWIAMIRNIRFPILSECDPLRSTMHLRVSVVRRAFLQSPLSWLTQGQPRRPCKIHLSSVGLFVIVTLSTFSFLVANVCRAAPRVLWRCNRRADS
jgi:hypothetical protein